jgi:hypothetical protein
MIGDARNIRNIPYRPPFSYPNDTGTPIGKSHKFQFFKKRLGNSPETDYTLIINQAINQVRQVERFQSVDERNHRAKTVIPGSQGA